MLKATRAQATVADAARSHAEGTTSTIQETSICRREGVFDGGMVSRSQEKPALAIESGSTDGTGAWFGAGSGSVGGSSVGGGSVGDGGSGKKGLRQELRVQMNIERKRARLFEDIQTLPYT